MYLGIEIGGTKLQLGVGPGDGTLLGLARERVDPAAGAAGIRAQILTAIERLDRASLQAIGIGFGGPVDDRRRCIIKSHQIAGGMGFPLPNGWKKSSASRHIWATMPTWPGSPKQDLAPAVGLDPVFYVTIGSGIGGGLIVGGKVHCGTGLGAAEIGHLRMRTVDSYATLEELCSGWGLEKRSGLRLLRQQRLNPHVVDQCDA